jgi:hypothetical protein
MYHIVEHGRAGTRGAGRQMAVVRYCTPSKSKCSST